MSISVNLAGEICRNTIQMLTEVAGAAAGPIKRTKTGLIDGLLNSLSREGAPVSISTPDGHQRDVDVWYMKRGTPSDATSSFPTSNCDFSRKPGFTKDTFSISLYSGREFAIDEQYIKLLCGGGNLDFYNTLIRSELDALKVDIEDQSITAVSGQFGNHVSTGNVNTVTHDLLDAAANDSINPGVYTTFASEVVTQNQFASPPIIVAGQNFWRFNKTLGMGCCNDNGVSVGELTDATGYSFFFSNRIDATLGAGQAIVFDPGSMQLVPFLNYRDIPGGDSVLKSAQAVGAYELMDGVGRGVMRDPSDGFPFNFKIYYDYCAEKYSILLFLCWDVWVHPTDTFQAGDALNGTNGVLHYTFT